MWNCVRSLPVLWVMMVTLGTTPCAFADLDISALLKQPRPASPTEPSSPSLPVASDKTLLPADPDNSATAALRTKDAESSFRDAVSLDTPGASREALIRASDLYREAAELGHVKAQSALGLMYAQGHGVDADDKRAAFWLSKAAKSGDATAQYGLGLLYYEGRGVARDYDRALSLYRDAAANGNAKAMNNLGIMHALGHGVKESNVEALAWFTLAADAGSRDAPANAELLKQELSETDLKAASERVATLTTQLGR